MEIRLVKDAIGNINFFAEGEDKEFLCNCGKQITQGMEGFLCNQNIYNKDIIFCKECQALWNMNKKCRYDERGEHQHICFTRIKEETKENANI